MTCKIDGCRRDARRRGWCDLHYQRWRRHGDPGADTEPQQRSVGCLVDGCADPHRAKGMCVRHYQRARSSGGVLPDVTVGPVCQVCGAPSWGGGRWCRDCVQVVFDRRRAEVAADTYRRTVASNNRSRWTKQQNGKVTA